MVGEQEQPDALFERNADTEFPPNVAVIKRVRLAFEGTFSEDPTSPTAELKPGAGGVVNFVVNMISSDATMEMKLNPDPELLATWPLYTDTIPMMFPDAYAEMKRFMEPNQDFKRPDFTTLWRYSVNEALIGGGCVGERLFANTDFKTVQNALAAAAQSNDYSFFDEHPCENIVVRGMENVIINRNRQTGMIVGNPFWTRSEVAKEYTPESFKGPLNISQALYFKLNATKQIDYYGQSFFAHVITEIIELGRIYLLAQRIAKDNLKPFPIVYVQPGLSDLDYERVLAMLRTFVQAQDKTKYETGVAIPGGQKFDVYKTDLDYGQIVAYLKYLHEIILTWLRIPVSLLLPESNYSVTEIHWRQFKDMVDEIRRTAWEGWVNTHFRPLLREKGLVDWEVTPIVLAFCENGAVIDVMIDGSYEIAITRRNTPVWNMQGEPPVEYYQNISQNLYDERAVNGLLPQQQLFGGAS